MQLYIEPILTAAAVFPFAAAIFTFPYMLFQYRRYGAVLLLRTVIVYSFILYLMCAYFLTMLPLPSIESVAALTTPYLQLEPFKDVVLWLRNADVVWSQPSTWGGLFNRDLFVILANVCMTIPLGIYLRYYFKCSFRKTVLIALAVSLIFELTQLSALFGIYPRPYRLCETDDLITNTLGGMIGYWITKPLLSLLPSRERIDALAYRHSTRVTFTRRLTAALVDWLILGAVIVVVMLFISPLHIEMTSAESEATLNEFGLLYFSLVTLYFILGEWLQKGQTIGKRLTHLRLADLRSADLQSADLLTADLPTAGLRAAGPGLRGGGRPKLWQTAVRYGSFYFGFLYLPFATLQLLFYGFTRDYVAWGVFWACGLMILAYAVWSVWAIVALFNRERHMPHSILSKTGNVNTFTLPEELAVQEKA